MDDLLVDMEIYFTDNSGETEYQGTITIQTDSRIFYMDKIASNGYKAKSVCEYSLPRMRVDLGFIELRIRTRPFKKIDVSE